MNSEMETAAASAKGQACPPRGLVDDVPASSCANLAGPAGEHAMEPFMAITKALADENRVRILLALRGGELCVCQIVELAQLATSTVSRHMSVLKHAKLVESRKDGRWMYYRLPEADAPELVQRAIHWVSRMLGRDLSVLRDARQLTEICSVLPGGPCAGQANGRHACHQNQEPSEVSPCLN
ncbi:MAG: metalloregulator ArsR/SmtB family transcription factor [Patescibacteria group bacterium]|nr:metalloregulator ArsR/SmtB family transcription factor [Patescibacteria group bacterium]